jgi:hypothetical protein
MIKRTVDQTVVVWPERYRKTIAHGNGIEAPVCKKDGLGDPGRPGGEVNAQSILRGYPDLRVQN